MSTPLVPGSRRELLVGVVGMVVAGLVGWLGFAAASGAFASGYEIEVEFERTGQGLTSFSDVRIRGIGVGDVMEVTAAPDGVAVVRMRLDDGVEVPRSATFDISALSVFGPKVVNIVPGPDELDGPFLTEGERVGLDRTSAPVDLEETLRTTDQILAELDLEALTLAITGLADAVDGQGGRFGELLDASAVVVDTVDRTTPDASVLLDNLVVIGDALADRGDDLVATLDTLNGITADFNDRRLTFDALLRQTSLASREVTDLLRDNAELWDLVISGLGEGAVPALQVIAGEADNLPALADAIGGFLGLLGDIIHVPGAEDTLEAAVSLVFDTAQPCTLVTLC